MSSIDTKPKGCTYSVGHVSGIVQYDDVLLERSAAGCTARWRGAKADMDGSLALPRASMVAVKHHVGCGRVRCG